MPGSREKNASEGFCFPGCLFFVQKDSGKPDSRAGARPLQRPYFLSTECASSRRVFISQNELSCEIKKAVWGIEYSFHRCSPYCFILLMPDRPYFPGSRIDPDHFLHGFDPVNQIVSHRKSAVFPEFVPCFIAVKYHQSASNSPIILYSHFPYLHGSSSPS